MLPASTKGGGFVVAFPDVCKVPAAPIGVPIPYPNIATTARAKQAQKKKVSGVKSIVSSKLSRSAGDEAGVLKGIKSSKRMAGVRYKMVSPKVMAEGQQLRTLLDGMHSAMKKLPPNDPAAWQDVLQKYVNAAAALYVTISDD